jgi:hypothetical protein
MGFCRFSLPARAPENHQSRGILYTLPLALSTRSNTGMRLTITTGPARFGEVLGDCTPRSRPRKPSTTRNRLRPTVSPFGRPKFK